MNTFSASSVNMSEAYAVLGATGKTGRSLLQILANQDKPVHAFVRSANKLRQMEPSICKRDDVEIFEGDISNVEVLADCICGTKAVFLCVASSTNVPGLTIAQDMVKSVLAALQRLRERSSQMSNPRLILLSSSSLSEHLSRSIPHLGHKIVLMAFSYIYEDLRRAEKILHDNSDIVLSTFVKPGGLSHDIQRGHILSVDEQQNFLSFLDLAAGMVQIADAEGNGWHMRDVCVLSKTCARFEWTAPLEAFKGLLCHFFPSGFFLWKHLPGF